MIDYVKTGNTIVSTVADSATFYYLSINESFSWRKLKAGFQFYYYWLISIVLGVAKKPSHQRLMSLLPPSPEKESL
jgi:hypothetical protein